MTDPAEQVEAVLAQVLTGASVVTAIDGEGQYITRGSARALAELVATDVVDALGLTERRQTLFTGMLVQWVTPAVFESREQRGEPT